VGLWLRREPITDAMLLGIDPAQTGSETTQLTMRRFAEPRRR
jgi:hypothetical protein